MAAQAALIRARTSCHFVAVPPEDHKGQRGAFQDGLDVFPVDGTASGATAFPAKTRMGSGSGAPAGELPDGVEHVAFDEDAVPWLQLQVGLAHLTVQHAVLGGGNLAVGMPVHRPRPVGQVGQLVAVEGNGKVQDLLGDLFPAADGQVRWTWCIPLRLCYQNFFFFITQRESNTITTLAAITAG